LRDLLIDRLYVLRLERRPTNDKRVKDNANGPGIDFEAMAISRVKEHLRRNIVRRSTDGLLPLARILYQGGKSEVSDLDVHVSIKEQVPELEVAMDDLMGVHVVACANELDHEEAGFRFREAATTAEHVHERSRSAEFEGHVHVVGIFETILEVDDVGMFKRAMYFDFCVELCINSLACYELERSQRSESE